MKKTTLLARLAAMATALLLPSISLAATLSFDRQLDAGGIAIVSSTCPAATSGGHVMFDLVQNGGTVRMATVGNIVAGDGSFGAFIKFPDNSPTGPAIVNAICPDGSIVSAAVTLQPFAGSVPLPTPPVTDSEFPVGGVAAGAGGSATANSLPIALALAGGIGFVVFALKKSKQIG